MVSLVHNWLLPDSLPRNEIWNYESFLFWATHFGESATHGKRINVDSGPACGVNVKRFQAFICYTSLKTLILNWNVPADWPKVVKYFSLYGRSQLVVTRLLQTTSDTDLRVYCLYERRLESSFENMYFNSNKKCRLLKLLHYLSNVYDSLTLSSRIQKHRFISINASVLRRLLKKEDIKFLYEKVFNFDHNKK